MNLLDTNSLWHLEGILPGGKSWFVPLDKFPFTVGRNAESSLCLNSISISRKHANFLLRKDRLYLVDLKSTNGTKVNHKKIDDEAELEDNDVISFGEFEFKIHSAEPGNEGLFSKTIMDIGSKEKNKFVKNFNLTKKESEILKLLLKGTTTRDIANRLSVSAGTAKNHILNIYKKTDTHSKFELFALYKKIED